MYEIKLFTLYTADMWNDLENKILSYADDKTLYAEVASPPQPTNVANSLNSYLVKIQSWCSPWGMKLNARKTHSITITRSRTPYPPFWFLVDHRERRVFVTKSHLRPNFHLILCPPV